MSVAFTRGYNGAGRPATDDHVFEEKGFLCREEEALHCALIAAGTEVASLIRRGLESRARAFQSYRLIMLPHLRQVDKQLASKLVVISWEIAVGGVMNKITTHSAELREMPWPTFQSELTSAVTAYLRAQTNQSLVE